MESNTNDLSKFGYVELKEAARLLNAYIKDTEVLDGDQVKLEFNPNSGSVFLVDEDFNVAMINAKFDPQFENGVCVEHHTYNLELWYNCPICGHEGFLEDMAHHDDNEEYDKECQEYLKDIGALQEA